MAMIVQVGISIRIRGRKFTTTGRSMVLGSEAATKLRGGGT